MTEGPKQITRPGRAKQRVTPQQKARIDSAKAKEGAPWAMISMIGIGGGFVGYAFNANGIQDATDAWFSGINHSVHKHDATVASGFMTALPFLCMLMGLAAIYLVLKWMGMGSSRTKKAPVLTDALTVHQFAQLTAAKGIGAKVSREAYRMFSLDYSQKMRTVLTQSLTQDLAVSRESVCGMFEELVQRSGGVIRTEFDWERLDTPISMMQSAEDCVERAALERRATLRNIALAETSRTVVPVPSER